MSPRAQPVITAYQVLKIGLIGLECILNGLPRWMSALSECF